MATTKIQNVLLGIIALFLVGYFLRVAKPVLFPFFIAVFISIFQVPIINFFHRYKIPKFLSIILTLVATSVILYLLGLLFYQTGKAFVSEFPKYSEKLVSLLDGIGDMLHIPPDKWNPQEIMKKIDMSKVGSMLLSSLGPFFSFLSKLFLVLVFLIFILTRRGKIRKKLEIHLDKPQASQLTNVIDSIDQEIQKYLAVKTLISFLTGLSVTIVLLLFGVDFALIWGFLTFLLNYIPQIGSIIATIFPVVVAVFQFPTIWPAIWILILLVAIQNVMGGFIEPKMMGQGLGLSPLVVLFSLFFWAWLWGLEGMIIAIPLTSGIKIVCRNIPSLNIIAVLLKKE